MTQRERDFYETRNPLKHDEVINTTVHPNWASERLFRELCKAVFNVHAMRYAPLSAPQWPSFDGAKPDQLPEGLITWAAYTFHKEHYTQPAFIRLGVEGGLAPIAAMHDAMSHKLAPGTPNNRLFLIGPIGSGKTTLVSNILVNQGPLWLTTSKLITVRADIDHSFSHHLPEAGSETKVLFECIYNSVKRGYYHSGLIEDSAYRLALQKSPLSEHDPETSIRNLYRRLYAESNEHHLLLILDNLDFLYHRYDRGLFIREAGIPITQLEGEAAEIAAERIRAYATTQKLIDLFAPDNPSLGNMGANILITLRRDSLEHYLHGELDLAEPSPLQKTYHIDTPDNTDVIAPHMALLLQIIDNIPKKRLQHIYRDAASTIDPRSQASERHQELYRCLCGLSRQGFRQVITHLGLEEA